MKTHLIAAAAVLFTAGAFAEGGGHSHAHPAAAATGHSPAAEPGHAGHDTVGVAGEASKVTRTIEVDMTDTMRFVPAGVTAKQGETLRFVVRNSGQLKHEFVLGGESDLKEHYEQMKRFPEMEHADDNMVSVAPGKTGELIWQFTKSGKVDFACLQPGHYEAGMKGSVKVVAGKAKAAATTSHGHGGHMH